MHGTGNRVKKKKAKRKQLPKMTPEEQSQKFIETANELGIGESDSAFEKAFKALTQNKRVKGTL